MTIPLETVAAEALALEPQERIALIERLISSVDAEVPLAPEWATEVERRVAEAEAGRAVFMTGDEALARLSRFIQSHRSA